MPDQNIHNARKERLVAKLLQLIYRCDSCNHDKFQQKLHEQTKEWNRTIVNRKLVDNHRRRSQYVRSPRKKHKDSIVVMQLKAVKGVAAELKDVELVAVKSKTVADTSRPAAKYKAVKPEVVADTGASVS